MIQDRAGQPAGFILTRGRGSFHTLFTAPAEPSPMLRFYEWHVDHRSALVLLAGMICAFACFASLSLMVRARAGGIYRPRMVAAAALVFAAGLSATLFVFTLAFHPAIPLGYRLGATLLPVAATAAVAWCAAALALQARAAGRLAALPRPGDFVAQSFAALWRQRGRRNPGITRQGLAAASLLALAICGVDFIAMGGIPAQDASAAARSTGPGHVADRPLSEKMAGDERASERFPGQASSRAAAGIAAAAAMRPIAAALPGSRSRDQLAHGDQSAKDITALATEIASAQNVDPLLALAGIATESRFQVDAVSPGNAQGLMQLMPETARRFGARDLLNPAENIRAGTSYLRWLLAYFEGDLSLALAAYNAGEGAVIHYGGVPPFPETRAYLRKIQTLYPAVAME
jgi:soluble lytic murein transglycosylase-like protein